MDGTYTNNKVTKAATPSHNLVMSSFLQQLQSSMRNCYPVLLMIKLMLPGVPGGFMFIRKNPCSVCRLLLRILLSAEQYAVMLGLWTVSNVVDSSNVRIRTTIFWNWTYVYGFLCCVFFMHRFCVQVELSFVNISSQFSCSCEYSATSIIRTSFIRNLDYPD